MAASGCNGFRTDNSLYPFLSRCLLDGIGWACLQFPFVGFGGERAGNQFVILVDEDVLELDLDPGVGQEGDMRVPAAGKHAVAARGFLDFKDEAVGGAYLVEFAERFQGRLIPVGVAVVGMVAAVEVRVVGRKGRETVDDVVLALGIGALDNQLAFVSGGRLQVFQYRFGIALHQFFPIGEPAGIRLAVLAVLQLVALGFDGFGPADYRPGGGYVFYAQLRDDRTMFLEIEPSNFAVAVVFDVQLFSIGRGVLPRRRPLAGFRLVRNGIPFGKPWWPDVGASIGSGCLLVVRSIWCLPEEAC